MLNTDKARPLAVSPDLFRPDPHAGFAEIRPQAGVVALAGLPLVTRHADVSALMTDPRTRQVETETLEMRGIRSGALHRFYANSMLLSNPPRHARRRRPAARAFAHKLIDAWRPRIRAIAAELIDEAIQTPGPPEVDFLDKVASPLPARLIAEIIGAPKADAPAFAQLVHRMSRGLGGFRDAELDGIENAAEALNNYVSSVIEARRRAPQDDFLSAYLARVSEGDPLTECETITQITTLILAGGDTTRVGLTAMVALLLKDRAQWEAVCADPSLAAGAVLESLRFEPPVGSIGRVLTEAIAVDGVRFEAGTVLGLSVLSAQRDPAVYADPQRFCIARADHPRWSVSFGLGPHRCLGEALARAELEEALIALTQRAPTLRLAEAGADASGAPRGFTGIRGATPLRLRIR